MSQSYSTHRATSFTLQLFSVTCSCLGGGVGFRVGNFVSYKILKKNKIYHIFA